MRTLAASTFCLLILAALSCKKEASNPAPAPINPPAPVVNNARQDLDVAYGSHPLQKLDIYFPQGYTVETPVVVIIHGGAWIEGSRTGFTDVAQWFVEEGFIAINMDYRLVDSTGLRQLPPLRRASDIRMQHQWDDVDSVLAWYGRGTGGWGSGIGRIFLAGHSAGAIMSLQYTQGTRNAGGRIKACGAWGGTTDLTITDTTGYNYPRWYMDVLYETLWRASGYEPVEANTLAFMALSPYWMAHSRTGAPTVSCMPENNDGIPHDPPVQSTNQHVQNFHRLLSDRGIPNEYVAFPGENHGFAAYPGSWREVVRKTAAFFRSVE